MCLSLNEAANNDNNTLSACVDVKLQSLYKQPQHHRNPQHSTMSMQDMADAVHRLGLSVPRTPIHLAANASSSRRRDIVICYLHPSCPTEDKHTDRLLLQSPTPPHPIPATMGVEESVYLAKLAEQAERYEGKPQSKRSADVRLLTPSRNGREHESCCLCRPGVVGGRAKSPIGCLQERHWRTPCFLEDRHFDRAEGGIQRQRGSGQAYQGLPSADRR